MATVTYSGPSVGAEVLTPLGIVTAERDVPVKVGDGQGEIPADVAKGLCKQEQWTRADKPATKDGK